MYAACNANAGFTVGEWAGAGALVYVGETASLLTIPAEFVCPAIKMVGHLANAATLTFLGIYKSPHTCVSCTPMPQPTLQNTRCSPSRPLHPQVSQAAKLACSTIAEQAEFLDGLVDSSEIQVRVLQRQVGGHLLAAAPMWIQPYGMGAKPKPLRRLPPCMVLGA
mgnify:CR=1 FL=1